MRRHRLRWYVFGAQAVTAYGRPRMTADVDAAVALGRRDVLAFLGELARAGFDLRIDLDEPFLRQARLLPLVHRRTAMPLDLVIAATRLHQEFLDRRRRADIGGVAFPLISPEDLVVTKLLAGRRKDIEDVLGVLLEQPRLDLERVRDLLRELEAALDDNRLLRRLDRVLRRARRTGPRRSDAG